ncbi:MAG: tetraacyldisaccharide 4'-kinase [Elusimicrobiota bacterium]|jgi:tetraacyldisaccharide 4'-kinase|nr:tetraacyldisaccharide 4'-kinase [Elusimicrobiota bacterium]
MDLVKLREFLLTKTYGRLILGFAAFVYGLGVKLILWGYKTDRFKSKKVNTRVVCIGNITAGGTGKTTAVLLAASELSQGGVRTSIVSRGYKRTKKKDEVVVLFDKDLLNWQETGDEPYMMSQLLASYKVPVLVSADRFAAASEALKQFKSQVILLDDGMQHHKLKRDANIVLIDAKNPFGGGKLLPLGTLREPILALRRANLIVITHSNLVPAREIENIKDEIRLINDGINILESIHKPDYFFDITTREKLPLDALKGYAVAFSAIGEPGSFEDTLRNLGINLKQVWRFNDHSTYTLENMQTFADLRSDLPLITTFKDFVKLPVGWQDILKDKVYILAINMEIQNGELGKFMEVLYPNFSSKK